MGYFADRAKFAPHYDGHNHVPTTIDPGGETHRLTVVKTGRHVGKSAVLPSSPTGPPAADR